jgi:hypothetical protein
MADNAISWFVLREADLKIIVYGTVRDFLRFISGDFCSAFNF